MNKLEGGTETLGPVGSAERKASSVLAVDVGKLRRLGSEWAENLKALSALVGAGLSSVAQEEWVAARMNEARALVSELEDDRKREVRPLIDQKNEIDAEYKKAATPVEEFVALCKAKLAEAALAREKEIQALREAAQEAAVHGDHDGCRSALAALPEAVRVAGVSVSEKWDFRVVDISKVRKELVLVDEKKVKGLCKAHDALGTPPVEPGLEFFKVAQVRATRGTKGEGK